ncbi:MAG: hypothetical protein RI900_1004 [Actinomycetota bacterium]|jgi:GT2 family glycosyltransferase
MISRGTPTVAAVVPVKDRPEELRRALQSILHQRMPADQVVVVDDGSTDPVDLSWWPAEAPPLTVIRNAEALGSGEARNVGVAEVVSDWVAFLDSDDQWLPSHLERVMASAPGAVAVITGYRASYGGDASQYEVRPNLGRHAHRRLLRLQNQPVSCTTTAVSVEWFHKVHGFRQPTAPLEDFDLVLRLAELGEVVSVREVTALKESGRGDRVYSVARDAAAVPVLMQMHAEALGADRVAARRFALRHRLRTHQSGPSARRRPVWTLVSRARLDLPRRVTSLISRRS